jgi:hypothetical protein
MTDRLAYCCVFKCVKAHLEQRNCESVYYNRDNIPLFYIITGKE